MQEARKAPWRENSPLTTPDASPMNQSICTRAAAQRRGRLGAGRSCSRSYSEDLQRRMARRGADERGCNSADSSDLAATGVTATAWLTAQAVPGAAIRAHSLTLLRESEKNTRVGRPDR